MLFEFFDQAYAARETGQNHTHEDNILLMDTPMNKFQAKKLICVNIELTVLYLNETENYIFWWKSVAALSCYEIAY